MSSRLGLPFMPWQDEVALVGGELVVDELTGMSVPAYRAVVVTVERQCGKTVLVLSWKIQRGIGWGRPQRMVYSAQTGLDARKKLVEDWSPILEPRKSKVGIRRILKANGSEAVEFANGSRIVLMGSGDDAGHGKTVDLAVKDEFFADYDDRRDQALVPAMATRADAQVLTLSTAGTDASIPLRRLVDQGRAAVDAGKRDGIAYFEWSFPDDADIDDPRVWWENIPALGYTITEDVIRQARETLPEGEFRRAFGNQWTTTDARVIPAVTWDLVNKPDAAPSGQLAVGVDMNPERSAAAIVAAGGGALEVIEHRPQVGWLLDSMTRIDRKQGHPVWVVDGSGPVGSMVPEMERAGLTVKALTPKELVGACGAFFDAVVDAKVQVRRHPSLDAAVAGAAKRASGDAWSWARKSSTVDISPLLAATAALWGASSSGEADFFTI